MDALSIIAVTTSPVLIAVIGWFLVRFVSRHDLFKNDIYKKLDIHAVEMKTETSKIEKVVDVLHRDLQESQQAMLTFKSNIRDELYSVKMETKDIASELRSASSSAKNINELIQKTEKTLQDNQKILQIVAKGIVFHKGELEKLKSEVVKINEDLVMIKKKV